MNRLVLLSLSLLAVTLLESAHAEQPVITIPVQVHLMRSSIHPWLQSTITETEVRTLWSEVNSIWSPAGIRFEISAVKPLDALPVPPRKWLQRDRNWVKSAIPMDKLHAQALDLCFIHEMGPNGFYYDEPVVVSETPGSYHVRGGATNRIARVIAHEFGHALTLQHRDPKTALMASNSTGITLNASEIAAAREAAAKWAAFFHAQRLP